ncbi:MAG: iron-containing alcohol dehydrogenase [Lachnospiraceae bacterium]
MAEILWNTTTKIYFGEGVTEEAIQKEAELFSGVIMIVTSGTSIDRLGHVDRLIRYIEQYGHPELLRVYGAISQNPRLEDIAKAAVEARQMKADTIIGFGGGSALDAAKAVAVGAALMVESDQDMLEQLEQYMMDGNEPGKSTKSVIAIPTTAGTGSEVSKAAIISSKRLKIKGGIRGDHIVPVLAIVDPEYTWSVSEKVTMETGFDVFAHAMESYAAVKANSYSEMLSEQAIRLVGENLPRLKKDSQDHIARRQMSYASLLMGMNLASVGTCLPHRIQYPVGARTGTTHAAGLAAIYPSWIFHEYQVNAAKVTRGIELLTGTRVENAREAAEAMTAFLRELEIDYSLNELGITDGELKELAEEVTGNIANDKLANQSDIMIRIIADRRE